MILSSLSKKALSQKKKWKWSSFYTTNSNQKY